MYKKTVICIMNILLITATEAEIAPLIKHIQQEWKCDEDGIFNSDAANLTILQAGVGMVATTYALTKQLAKRKYDLVLQAGVGGSFNRNLKLGDVVCVQTEQIGDLGAEDNDKYLSMFDIGLVDKHEYPFSDGKLLNSNDIEDVGLPRVSGVTVNTVTGSERSVATMAERCGADVESMEGAALHYVCLMEKVPFLQVRAISNYVEPRNRDAWEMGLAITKLNQFLVEYLAKL